MDFNKSKGRIWLENEAGELIAEVLFPEIEPSVVEITHTFVDDSLRGQGVAAKLMEKAAETIAEDHQKAILTCSYAQAWFARHKEYDKLLR